jgi:hypothetical protein
MEIGECSNFVRIWAKRIKGTVLFVGPIAQVLFSSKLGLEVVPQEIRRTTSHLLSMLSKVERTRFENALIFTNRETITGLAISASCRQPALTRI